MKVWQVILMLFMIAIILVLGMNYIKLSNEYNELIVENNNLADESSEINNVDDIGNVDSVEDDITEVNEEKGENETDYFYDVVKNNVNNYRIFDYNKTKKENAKYYINILKGLDTNIPIFSEPNQLETEHLNQIFRSIVLMKSDVNIYLDDGDIVLHKDFMTKTLTDLFGDKFDVNKINITDSEIYPFEGYDDIYTTSSYAEWSELCYAGYLIADYKETDENIEVTIIEYTLEDDGFVLDVSETSKRRLYNNKSEEIKSYDIGCVEVGDKLDLVIKDNGNIVTDEDIEKYILDNKDKFEMKKITFKEEFSELRVVSCEVVK